MSLQYPFPQYFYGKTVLITGSSSGLGEALAVKACEYGAKVIMTGRNMVGLEMARQKLVSYLGNNQLITFAPTLSILDVSDPKSIADFTREYLSLFDNIPPDIIINNAGISYRGEIYQTDISVDKILMETNYFGPVQIIKSFLPLIIKRKSGIIVNISSIQGKLSIPFRSAYSASKHALQAFTDCLRAEVSKYNIFVCLVSPGYINTKLSLNSLNPDGSLYNKLDKNTAQGMDPLKVAETILRGLTGPKRKPEILIMDFKYRAILLLRWLLPDLFFNLMNKRATKKIPIFLR